VSSYPLVKFVDSPAVGATVRLDLNDAAAAASRRVEADFDLGVPTLEGDPDAVGQQFGFRSPRFTVQVKGTKANALAFVSALSKELLRRTNWVMFQLNAATSPVWFRTFRTGYQSLPLDRVFASSTTGGNAPAGYVDVWRVEVPLVADAFAYGARVTQSAVTVGNNSSATNPLRVVLPALKGDAQTGLRVAVNMAGLASGSPESWLTAVIGADSGTVTDTVVDIGTGDVFTAGSGTSAPSTVGGTAYWGGSYRTVTISAAGGNLLERISGTLAAAPPPGRYKVLLRCQADPINVTTANRYSFAVGQDVNGEKLYASTVFIDTPVPVPSFNAPSFIGWVDLGEIPFPFGNTELPADAPTTAPAPTLSLKVGTPAGVAGTVRLDAIKLIPVSGPKIRKATFLNSKLITGVNPATIGYFGMALATTDTGTWDGDSDVMWGAVTASGVLRNGSPAHKGGYPVADPSAAQNVLLSFPLSIPSSAGPNLSTSVLSTWDVVVSYYPRFLHVGDGT
jgi:hypothetical protein